MQENIPMEPNKDKTELSLYIHYLYFFHIWKLTFLHFRYGVHTTVFWSVLIYFSYFFFKKFLLFVVALQCYVSTAQQNESAHIDITPPFWIFLPIQVTTVD